MRADGGLNQAVAVETEGRRWMIMYSVSSIDRPWLKTGCEGKVNKREERITVLSRLS